MRILRDLLPQREHDIDPHSSFCRNCRLPAYLIIEDNAACWSPDDEMWERSDKVVSGELPAAWLAVSQPFGLADNAPALSRETDMPQPHGLDFRRQEFRNWQKSSRDSC